MRKFLHAFVILVVRVLAAAIYLLFMQYRDAKSVLLTGEHSWQKDGEEAGHEREQPSLTSDEVCEALMPDFS